MRWQAADYLKPAADPKTATEEGGQDAAASSKTGAPKDKEQRRQELLAARRRGQTGGCALADSSPPVRCMQLGWRVLG